MNKSQGDMTLSATTRGAAHRRSREAAAVAVVFAIAALAGASLLPVRRQARPVALAAATATVPPSRSTSTAVALALPGLRVPRPRPIRFEPNVGQSQPGVRFVAQGPGFTADVLDDGLRLTQRQPVSAESAAAAHGSARVDSARLRFVGMNAGPAFEAREPGAAVSNYFIGSDASRWLRNVPGYRQLRRPQVYPGIDLVYYGRDGEFEYDLVVQPGADASRIRLAVDGARHPSIDASGDLLLDGAGGALRMHKPVLYQHIDGRRKTLEGRYVMLAANEVGFRLPVYDHTHPLVIDPTFKLLYASYLGGVHDDQVGNMVLDAQGNAYVVGNSGSEDWPVSGNAYQTTRKAIGRYVRNVVVAKFDASGTLVYSTFIGGSTNDYGVAIAVDAGGSAYLTGYTNSSDFPVTPGAYQATFNGGQSAYLAVLSPDGSALRYSTLYGGTGGASGSGIALEAAGTVLVGGSAGPGLPTTPGSYKTSLSSGNAAFLARFDLGAAGPAQLQAATYYGTDAPQTNYLGAGNLAYALALDPAGTPWLTGQAYTTNLPVSANPVMASPATMTPSCSVGSLPLNSFAYVAHLSADLKTLVYASYLTGRTGGPATCAEYGHGLAFDAAGNVYVGGSTSSLAYPTTAGALQAVSPANSSTDGYAAFVTKLKPDGSAVLWSTYLGGNAGRTYLAGLLGDSSGALWVSSTSAGGSNFPISADALQATHGGGTFDVAFSKLDGTSGALLYSSFLGGAGDDGVAGFAVDASGNAYIAGTTTSANFPVTPDAFQPGLTANAYDGADWFFSILGSGTISRVLPTASGNGGDLTMSVYGVGLQQGATASLVSGATTIPSRSGSLAADAASETFGFSLDAAASGTYDLVVANPDGTVITKKSAFTVQANGTPVLSAQVLGRSKFRTGVPTTYQVLVSNTGTQEAIMVPVWISVPATATLAIDSFSAADTAAMLATTDAGTTYVNRFIGKLSPGESVSIDVHVTTSADSPFVPVTAALQAPWFRTGAQMDAAFSANTYDSDCVVDSANAAYSNCFGPYQNFAAIGGRAFASGLAISPAAAKAAAARAHALGDLCKAFDHGKESLDKGRSDGKEDLKNGKGPGDPGSDFNRDVPNPGKDPIGWINYNAGYVQGQFDVITGYLGGSSAAKATVAALRKQPLDGEACPVNPSPTPPTIQPPGSGGGGSGGAIDPNDKTGPRGDGSASHFIRADAPLAYQVEFENQPTAALPAANVVVTDQLDPAKVDLSSFALGPISFGSTTVAVPPGLASYQTTVALSASLSVRIQGSLDPSTGLAKWTFTSIDPATGLPPSDPTLGFLPPDSDGVVGQGAIGFTVRQRSGAADATVYANQASVVFDANAAIVTPTWVNTVDSSVPSSKVQSLVGEVGTMDFDVTWGGTDTGSGIANYTVYVSDNGGPYTVWQASTTATTATYSGVSGHSYAFYAIASDGAGNSEAAKSTPEATIAVSGAFAAPTTGSGSGGGGCTIGGDGRSDPLLPLVVIVAAGVVFIARRRAAPKPRRAAD